jgi:hypothetical protein
MVLSSILSDLLSFQSSWGYVKAVADAMEGEVLMFACRVFGLIVAPSQPTTTPTSKPGSCTVTLASATSCWVKTERGFSSIGINP